MSALTLSTSSATALRADAVVVGVAKGAKGPVVAPGAEAVDKAYGGKLAASWTPSAPSGGEGEMTKLPAPAGFKAPVVLAVGLGEAPEKDDSYDPETLRRAAGTAARALAGTKKAAFALPVEDAADVAAVAEGALLGAYSFTPYKEQRQGRQGQEAARAPLGEVTLLGAQAARQGAQGRRRARRRRRRGAQPRPRPDQHPAERPHPGPSPPSPQAAAKEHGLKVEVLDEKALAKGGYGGILGVGQGSADAAAAGALAYTHPKAKKYLALVGKGITYDSGGISLKPAGHNETMKCDMSGAAAVFAAVVAAARLGLQVNVTGWLALAENMPSGSATRPGDVLRMYSGKTVEVLNTDAEGRLVLADALSARLRGEAGRHRGRGDADRRDGAGAGQPDVRHHGERRRVPHRAARGGRGGRRGVLADAAAGPTCARAWTPRSPTSRTWASGWAAAWSRACSCRSSSTRASPGRTWTSRDRRSTRAAPSATPPRAARAPRCARWSGSPSAPPTATWADGAFGQSTVGCGRMCAGSRGRRAATRRSPQIGTAAAPWVRAREVSHTGPASRSAADKCEDGARQDRAPTTGPKKERPDTSRRPVSTDRRPAHPCMEDVTWRTTPAPFST